MSVEHRGRAATPQVWANSRQRVGGGSWLGAGREWVQWQNTHKMTTATWCQVLFSSAGSHVSLAQRMKFTRARKFVHYSNEGSRSIYLFMSHLNERSTSYLNDRCRSTRVFQALLFGNEIYPDEELFRQTFGVCSGSRNNVCSEIFCKRFSHKSCRSTAGRRWHLCGGGGNIQGGGGNILAGDERGDRVGSKTSVSSGLNHGLFQCYFACLTKWRE